MEGKGNATPKRERLEVASLRPDDMLTCRRAAEVFGVDRLWARRLLRRRVSEGDESAGITFGDGYWKNMP